MSPQEEFVQLPRADPPAHGGLARGPRGGGGREEARADGECAGGDVDPAPLHPHGAARDARPGRRARQGTQGDTAAGRDCEKGV